VFNRAVVIVSSFEQIPFPNSYAMFADTGSHLGTSQGDVPRLSRIGHPWIFCIRWSASGSSGLRNAAPHECDNRAQFLPWRQKAHFLKE